MLTLTEHAKIIVEESPKGERVYLDRFGNQLLSGSRKVHGLLNFIVLFRNALHSGIVPPEMHLGEEDQANIDHLIRKMEATYKIISPQFLNYISMNKNRKQEILTSIQHQNLNIDPVEHTKSVVMQISNKINSEILAARRSLPSLDARKAPRQRKRPRYVKKKFIEKRQVLNFYSSNFKNLANLFVLNSILLQIENFFFNKTRMDGYIRLEDDFLSNPTEYEVIINSKREIKLLRKSDI